jgi:hypothetical protein
MAHSRSSSRLTFGGVGYLAGHLRLDGIGPEHGSQPRHVQLQGRRRVLRQLLSPQRVDQVLGRHNPVGAQDEVREHDPLLGTAQRDRARPPWRPPAIPAG